MQQVCRDFSLAPNELLAIGDSSNDALAARAAGCKVMVVPYGYNHGLPVQTIDADGIVETLYQAAGLLATQALQ
jgi:phosphoglycolate phosphatase